MAELVRTVNFAETFAALRLGESVDRSILQGLPNLLNTNK